MLILILLGLGIAQTPEEEVKTPEDEELTCDNSEELIDFLHLRMAQSARAEQARESFARVMEQAEAEIDAHDGRGSLELIPAVKMRLVRIQKVNDDLVDFQVRPFDLPLRAVSCKVDDVELDSTIWAGETYTAEIERLLLLLEKDRQKGLPVWE